MALIMIWLRLLDGRLMRSIQMLMPAWHYHALPELIDQLEIKMKAAAKQLDFEEAANLRDRIKQLRQKLVGKA